MCLSTTTEFDGLWWKSLTYIGHIQMPHGTISYAMTNIVLISEQRNLQL